MGIIEWIKSEFQAGKHEYEAKHSLTTANAEAETDSGATISEARTSEPGCCPRCGSSLWKPMATAWRCSQCGYQSVCRQTIGASRADLPSA